MNDGYIYAFSDTLLQYLLLNVITNHDEIDYNIARIQEYLSSIECRNANKVQYKTFYKPGIWGDDLRDFIFDLVMTSDNLPVKLDKNGFVDRQTETIILRGQKV